MRTPSPESSFFSEKEEFSGDGLITPSVLKEMEEGPVLLESVNKCGGKAVFYRYVFDPVLGISSAPLPLCRENSSLSTPDRLSGVDNEEFSLH